MKKKLFAVLLSILLLAACMPMSVSAAEWISYGDYLTFCIEDGEATLSDCDENYSGHLLLPDTIEGYPVTAIGPQAFWYCDDMLSVSIPDSVTAIFAEAFAYCGGLTAITIPGGVDRIGDNAFEKCYNLTTVVIEDGVTEIGNYVFHEDTAITSVTLPDTLEKIGKGAFYQCDGLTEITIPTSVTTIGESAFYLCDELESVYYDGTEKKWNKIEIGDDNDPLLDAYENELEDDEDEDKKRNDDKDEEEGNTLIWVMGIAIGVLLVSNVILWILLLKKKKV